MTTIRSAHQSDIAQLKEYYTQREAERDEKHKNEILNLRDTQTAQLESVRANSQNAVDSSKDRMKEKLTEMDQKHQKDIESLKALYQKKLEKFEKA